VLVNGVAKLLLCVVIGSDGVAISDPITKQKKNTLLSVLSGRILDADIAFHLTHCYLVAGHAISPGR
jgi:hypothetical protein